MEATALQSGRFTVGMLIISVNVVKRKSSFRQIRSKIDFRLLRAWRHVLLKKNKK